VFALCDHSALEVCRSPVGLVISQYADLLDRDIGDMDQHTSIADARLPAEVGAAEAFSKAYSVLVSVAGKGSSRPYNCRWCTTIVIIILQ